MLGQHKKEEIKKIGLTSVLFLRSVSLSVFGSIDLDGGSLAFTRGHCLAQGIPNSAEKDGAEEVLERCEGVVYAEQKGGQFEVDKENNYSKIDQRLRSRYELGLLVENEYDGGNDRRFSRAEI